MIFPVSAFWIHQLQEHNISYSKYFLVQAFKWEIHCTIFHIWQLKIKQQPIASKKNVNNLHSYLSSEELDPSTLSLWWHHKISK